MFRATCKSFAFLQKIDTFLPSLAAAQRCAAISKYFNLRLLPQLCGKSLIFLGEKIMLHRQKPLHLVSSTLTQWQRKPAGGPRDG
jgi:hypothetical protein